MYRVGITRGRFRYFATLESASRFCGEVFNATRIVLSIEQVKESAR